MTAQTMFPNLTLGLDLSDTIAHYYVVNAHDQILQTGRARVMAAALERAVAPWSQCRQDHRRREPLARVSQRRRNRASGDDDWAWRCEPTLYV